MIELKNVKQHMEEEIRMSFIPVIIICAVLLVIFIIFLISKGMGAVLDILTTPKKLLSLLLGLAILYAAAAFILNR